MKDSIRYNNCRIDNIPTESFPELVIISKAPKKLNMIRGKKYVNLTKAKLAIDYQNTLNRIESTNVKTSDGDLASVVIINE